MNWLWFIHEEPIIIKLGSWITLGELQIDYSIILDSLSMSVMVPVGIVTICVLWYAIEYMHHDPNLNRFLIILSIFAVFMSVLVVSDNYLMMFIGWEFVGVISYLLISFWSTRIDAMKSALSAILLNRLGDTFFIIAMAIMLNTFYTLNFYAIELLVPNIEIFILNIIATLLFLAACAKSAQFGFHSWLLLAMEGPTPVSSLLHAATMVCSGVYVLVRSWYILEYTPSVLIIILYLGGITTIVSGLIATVTNDIKRVIALSTMSQLGMMMIAIGISAYDLSIYHLYCHAFFKALLFMSAGSIIHACISETQDMRKYGGFRDYLPFSYTAMLIASLSLMAIPGLSGYYSKDIIIESVFGLYDSISNPIYYISVASATLTAIYSTRVAYLTFFNTPRGNKYTFFNLDENIKMIMPMVVLLGFSIYLGSYKDNILPFLSYGLPQDNNFIETEYTLSSIIKLLPLILGLSLSLLLVYYYEFNYKLNNSTLLKFLSNRLAVDLFINTITRYSLSFSGLLNKFIDNGFLKVLGDNGLSQILSTINIKLYNK